MVTGGLRPALFLFINNPCRFCTPCVSLIRGQQRAHGIKSPWQFWNIRDLRTLLDVAKDLAGFDKKSVPFVGIEHHALHDALHETKLAAEALRAMRGKEEMPLNMVVSVD